MKATLLRHWGTDLDVVNNARVSFDKTSAWDMKCTHCQKITGSTEGHATGNQCDKNYCMFTPELKEADKRIIGFLARGCTSSDWDKIIQEVMTMAVPAARYEKARDDLVAVLNNVKNMPSHWAPFANGVGLQFHFKAPVPIMRQVFKHKVGSVESEVSRRYVDSDPEYFTPDWRKAAPNVKQGSTAELLDDPELDAGYQEVLRVASNFYHNALQRGVPPEQARFVLPQGAYTEARISNSLYGWANFCIQRQDRNHAQREVADLADEVAAACRKHFPESWAALVPTLD